MYNDFDEGGVGEFEDKELTCADCNDTFVFTAGEQKFYASKNFSRPRRCQPCRTKKKMAKEQQS